MPMPRTIEEILSELPLHQQDEVERRHQELRQTLINQRFTKIADRRVTKEGVPPPQVSEASDASSTASETKQHPQHRS